MRKRFYKKKRSKWDSNPCPADDATCGEGAEIYVVGKRHRDVDVG